VVRKAEIRENGNSRWAVAKTAKRNSGLSMDNIKELRAMAIIKPHPNLVQFYGVVTLGSDICFLVEYCEKGSLSSLHKTENLLAIPMRLKIIRDISSGLVALHQSRIVHRDLACRNLLMKLDGTVVLSDYGLSRQLDDEDEVYLVKTSKFPWAWTSPETIETGNFSMKSDIWSFGVTLWEVITKGRFPYGAALAKYPKRLVVDRIINGTLKISVPEWASEQMPFFTKVLNECLRHDDMLRPTAAEILKMTEEELKFAEKKLGLIQESPIYVDAALVYRKSVVSNTKLCPDSVVPKDTLCKTASYKITLCKTASYKSDDLKDTKAESGSIEDVKAEAGSGAQRYC